MCLSCFASPAFVRQAQGTVLLNGADEEHDEIQRNFKYHLPLLRAFLSMPPTVQHLAAMLCLWSRRREGTGCPSWSRKQSHCDSARLRNSRTSPVRGAWAAPACGDRTWRSPCFTTVLLRWITPSSFQIHGVATKLFFTVFNTSLVHIHTVLV